MAAYNLAAVIGPANAPGTQISGRIPLRWDGRRAPPYGSATLGSWPCLARWPSASTPSPDSPTGASEPTCPDYSASTTPSDGPAATSADSASRASSNASLTATPTCSPPTESGSRCCTPRSTTAFWCHYWPRTPHHHHRSPASPPHHRPTRHQVRQACPDADLETRLNCQFRRNRGSLPNAHHSWKIRRQAEREKAQVMRSFGPQRTCAGSSSMGPLPARTHHRRQHPGPDATLVAPTASPTACATPRPTERRTSRAASPEPSAKGWDFDRPSAGTSTWPLIRATHLGTQVALQVPRTLLGHHEQPLREQNNADIVARILGLTTATRRGPVSGPRRRPHSAA